MRKLEALFAALIFTMMVCFFIIFVQTRPVWLGAPWDPDGSGIILGTLVPTTSDFAVVQAVGILGAVIMPHNIYLHSALVQSRKINRQDHTAVAEACKYNAIESAIALGVSYLINAAVVTVFARGFFNKEECARPGWDINTFTGGAGAAAVSDNGGSANLGCYTGKDRYGPSQKDSCHRFSANSTDFMLCTNQLGEGGVCCQIGLQNAGQALEGLLGHTGKIVWAVGLLAAGQASTMTGTFAGQHVMEGFLNWKVSPVARVTITRSIALGPAIAVGLYMATNTAAGDVLNEWLNILQSVQLPFALLPVLHFTSSKRLMGRFVNGGWVNTVCWLLAALVVGINVYLIIIFVTDPSSLSPPTGFFWFVLVILFVLYFGFILTIIWSDLKLAYAGAWSALAGSWGTRRRGGDGVGPKTSAGPRTAFLIKKSPQNTNYKVSRVNRNIECCESTSIFC